MKNITQTKDSRNIGKRVNNRIAQLEEMRKQIDKLERDMERVKKAQAKIKKCQQLYRDLPTSQRDKMSNEQLADYLDIKPEGVKQLFELGYLGK